MWPMGARSIVRASLVLALTACGQPLPPGAAPQDEPGRGSLLIHGTGDVGLDPRQIPGTATRGYGWAWTGLRGLFVRDDLTVVNLECPVTDHVAPAPKPVTFRCDPRALPAARRAGVDVVSQANNHAADQGVAGLLDSAARIRAADLVSVGTGGDRSEALEVATVRREGWTVAVLGIDQVADPGSVAGARRPGTAPGREMGRVTAVLAAASISSDLVIVMVHWGLEGSAEPSPLQVRQAHRMIDAGADVIFGSHAHRLHPLEIYRGRPIFYGLGNTVWPLADGASGGIGEVLVRPDGSIEARLRPVRQVAHGYPVLAVE
jgi:hypothetical protein